MVGGSVRRRAGVCAWVEKGVNIIIIIIIVRLLLLVMVVEQGCVSGGLMKVVVSVCIVLVKRLLCRVMIENLTALVWFLSRFISRKHYC